MFVSSPRHQKSRNSCLQIMDDKILFSKHIMLKLIMKNGLKEMGELLGNV